MADRSCWGGALSLRPMGAGSWFAWCVPRDRVAGGSVRVANSGLVGIGVQRRAFVNASMLTEGGRAAVSPSLEFATMTEWWRLTGRYPEYRRYSHALLKEYGYMRLMDLFDTVRPKRALEFGHGFNATLLEHGQGMCEMHGIDDDHGLVYFPSGEEWESLYAKSVASVCTGSVLHRGLLGGGNHDLEEGSFDVIASVSVLEELDPDVLDEVVADCARLLAPGGRLAGTYDLLLSEPTRLCRFTDACEKAGLVIPKALTLDDVDWNAALLECPSVVMCTYQMGQEEEGREYDGHWTASWFVAQKAA